MADLNNHLRISFDMMQFSIGEIENVQKAQNADQDKTNKTYKETHKSTGEREPNCVVSMCKVLNSSTTLTVLLTLHWKQSQWVLWDGRMDSRYTVFQVKHTFGGFEAQPGFPPIAKKK